MPLPVLPLLCMQDRQMRESVPTTGKGVTKIKAAKGTANLSMLNGYS